MRRWPGVLCIAVAFAAVLGVSAEPVVATAPAFTAIDLGTFGGTFGEAVAINNHGAVVGFSNTAGDAGRHGFYWTSATGMVDLGNFQANSINDEGMVVGDIATSDGSSYHAAIWTPTGGMADLGTLGGTTSYGMAADSLGRVFGDSDTPDGEHHAFMWTPSGGMIDLGTLGGPLAVVNDVSENGQAVGYSRISASNGAVHAFRWTDAGGMHDLGTIGGSSSFASAVSETGQVVGYGYPAGSGVHAWSWTASGGMVDIGTLGGCCSQTNGPNAVSATGGQVVGASYTTGNSTSGPQAAFSWTPGGGLLDLGTLGGSVTSAVAVNSSGHVAGEGTTSGDAELDAFFWTPADGIIDLGTLGGTESQAVAMNNSDQIVGYADPAGDLSADPVLWQPAGTENGSTTQTVSGGSTVSTDPQNLGATADIPVQTTLTVPQGAGAMTVSIAAQPSTGTAPSGFNFFGDQVVIDNGGVVAAATSPYVVSFTVDSSLLGAIAPTDVQVFRDGVPAQPCTDPSAAIPDPCVVSTAATVGGDALVTVRTTHFSKWNFGKLSYTFSGFNQPVDNLPTVNATKAGNAIPVKFSLGGNKGLNVFQSGYPSQGAINCQSGAPVDAIEQTVTAGSSSLSYDSTSNTYTYVWKTDKSWAGTCRELTVRLRDGSVKRADFSFSK